MVFDDEAKKKMMIYFSIAVFVGIIIYALITSGAMGARAVLWSIVKYTVILGIIFAIMYVGYKIFFAKTEVNLVANDRKDIVEAGTLCKPPLLRDLYLTGDKEHGESRLGRVIGYCQIQNYEDAEEGLPIAEDCIIFKKYRFPISWFEDPKVLRCYPEEHSQLIGDIRVFAVSPILKYGYYFPNSAFLNVRRIDQSIIKEAWRGQIHETLKDLVAITKRASGLDSEQQKQLDYRKLLKIPTSTGESESRESQ
jgi:hypothetical protein